MSLSLSNSDWQISIRPQMGGSFESCFFRGKAVLRDCSAAPHTAGPLELAAFPCFPFSGRIRHGKFSFRGQDVALPLNFLPEVHAIHGQAWQAPWNVVVHTPVELVMDYVHSGDIWPWAYKATQHFFLIDNKLNLVLRLENQSKEPMPAGMGWHPYFTKANANLSADVSHIWLSVEGAELNTAPHALNEPHMLSTRTPVSSFDLDANFTSKPGGTDIFWDGVGQEKALHGHLAASSVFEHLVIYTPPEEAYFCVEPVVHAPDAVNSALQTSITGLRVLEPWDALEGTISLTVNYA